MRWRAFGSTDSWDRLWDQVDECDRDIAALAAQRKGARSDEQRRDIEEECTQLDKLRAMIIDKIGERPKR